MTKLHTQSNPDIFSESHHKKEQAMAQFNLVAAFVLLLFGICTFGAGIYQIMSGYHSLDLAQDINRLTLQLGHNPDGITECNLGGNCYDLQKTYMDGSLRLLEGVKITIVASIFLPIEIFIVIAASMNLAKV